MRWPLWRVQAEPPHSWDRHAWQIYIEALGARDIPELEEQIRDLATPEPKTEGERNRQRQERLARERRHLDALRELIYPPDEEPDARPD